MATFSRDDDVNILMVYPRFILFFEIARYRDRKFALRSTIFKIPSKNGQKPNAFEASNFLAIATLPT